MVTKVVTEHDVDNVTIIINSQNKLEAKIPTSTPSEVVIEEVPNVTTANDVVTLDGTMRKITKLGKVNGTEWLVFQLDAPKPHIQKTINVEFYDDVVTDSGDGMTFYHTGKVRVTTDDGSSFTPNGSSAYNAVSDSVLRAVLQGNTQYDESVLPVINFNTMTYSLEVTYSETQTSSTFESVGSLGTYFSAEHEDVIYDYTFNSVSRGADTPAQPEPEQPPNSSINTYLYYSCVDVTDMGTFYELSFPIPVQVTTSDTGGKTPQTVKFDVTLGSQTRTYSYPYSPNNVYNLSSIDDFNYEGHVSYGIHNARVEFTDGSVSLSSANTIPGCMMGSLPA